MIETQHKAKVIDKNSGEVLFTCDLEQIEIAYDFAARIEEMGFDVEVQSPTVSETLISELGLDEGEKSQFRKSLEAEIDEHDDSCCYEEKGADNNPL